MSALESQIDELYQAPLAGFTAARNALAKTLSKTEAARVKKLPKPTAVPWAINQLYWKSRPTWDRLLKSGEKLRAVQLATLKGRAGDLREVSEGHRRVVSEAAKAAERVASQTGSAPPADALMRALEALSLMSEAPKPPGRLTEAPRPAGFEALTGVPVRVPAPILRMQPNPKKEAQKKRQEEAAAKKAAAAAKKRDAEIRKAEAALAAARAKLAKLKET